MRGKIILMALLITSCAAANIRAEEIKLRPLDFTHPAVKAAIALQEARRSYDLKLLWEQLSQNAQRILGPDGFKDFYTNPMGRWVRVQTSKADLSGIRFITDDRVWVEVTGVSSPDWPFKGFYFVKEGGVWKFAPIERYLKEVDKDLDSLSNSISDYYKKNNKLPKDLAELSIDIAADLFSDSNAPYQYKALNDFTYVVYSLGPDSDDDNGAVAYSRKDHPISDGDIIKRVAMKQ
jgi:hypothetical protein